MSKVTAYTENTAPSSDDMLYIVDSAAGASPTGKKVQVESILSAITSAAGGGGATGSSGAMLTINATPALSWLAKPTSGSLLTYSTAGTTGPVWTKTDPGTVMVGSTLNAPTMLAAPASGAILSYSTAGTSGPSWSLPTSASVLTGSSLGTPAWTAAGTSGQVLTIVDTHPAWAAAAGGGGSSTINLPAAAWQPTNNASSWASAQLAVYQSSASVPSPRYNEWLFDPTTREHIVTTFRCPPNYAGASAPVLTFQYYSTAAVSSGTMWGVQVGGLPTSGDFAGWVFGATAALSATQALPTSAFDLGVVSITLTEGSSLFAAGNFMCLTLFRNATNAGDAGDGDMHVVSAELAYC